MLSPAPRGSLSGCVLEALRSGETSQLANAPEPDGSDDAQLTLWTLYELHHRGFDDVSDELEWDPHLIGVRRRLEADFEATLRARTPSFPSLRISRRPFSILLPTMRAHRYRPICTGLRAPSSSTSFSGISRFII